MLLTTPNQKVSVNTVVFSLFLKNLNHYYFQFSVTVWLNLHCHVQA